METRRSVFLATSLVPVVAVGIRRPGQNVYGKRKAIAGVVQQVEVREDPAANIQVILESKRLVQDA